MSGLMDSISRVRLIAGNTFLEAVRQKFFNSLLLISVALVASSTFFQQFDFGTGESLRDFDARSIVCLRSIAERHAGAAVLVFTHGGVLEMLLRAATARGLRSVRDFEIPNAAINRFDYAAGAWTLRAWAERAHLEAALDDLRD